MKNYVKPSIELNRFDVEDIITTSGDLGMLGAEMTETAQGIYDQHIDAGYSANANVAEFQW
ncbi:MAG: hypothetical protein J6C82_00025 [Clostridia bacterium]|nr:hypothetical protein [Clostridia bacterium]